MLVGIGNPHQPNETDTCQWLGNGNEHGLFPIVPSGMVILMHGALFMGRINKNEALRLFRKLMIESANIYSATGMTNQDIRRRNVRSIQQCMQVFGYMLRLDWAIYQITPARSRTIIGANAHVLRKPGLNRIPTQRAFPKSCFKNERWNTGAHAVKVKIHTIHWNHAPWRWERS